MQRLALSNRWTVFLIPTVLAIVYSYGIFTGNVLLLIGLYLLTFSSLATYGLAFHKKWMYYLSIASIPVSIVTNVPGTGMSLSMPSELLEFTFFALFIGAAIFKGIDRKILTHPLTILLLLDIVWILIASLFSTMPEVSFKRLLMRTNYLCVFYVLFADLNLQYPQKSNIPFLSYAIGLIFTMIYTIYQLASYDFDPRVAFILSQPFFAEHTVYGACLAFIIPFVWFVVIKPQFNLNKFARIFFGGLLILLLISISIALSRAALLSLLVAFVFWILVQFRIKVWTILSMLIIIGTGAYTYRLEIYNQLVTNKAVSNDGNVANHFNSVTNIESDASNLERINRWICAWEMFQDKPLTGFGPGTYQFQYAQYQSWQYKTHISTTHGNKGNAHSEYLGYLSETGFVGLLLFLSIVFYSLHIGLKSIYRSSNTPIKYITLSALLGLVTFYFHGIFNAFSDQDEMAFLYYGSLGIVLLADINLKNQIESTQTNADF